MPEVSQQESSFNKGILMLQEFKAHWASSLLRTAEGRFMTPSDNPMQLEVYSAQTVCLSHWASTQKPRSYQFDSYNS